MDRAQGKFGMVFVSLLPKGKKKVHKLFLGWKLNKTEVLYIHLGFYVEFI